MAFEEEEDSFEHTLLIVREVHVYKIPPRMSSGGYKCSEWLVSDRIWSGRLRLISIGDKCEIRLEDTQSGELFAACPVIPGKRDVSIENVLDSSRYFVLRIDDGKGHRAFVGLGFNERSESFDFNVAISDYEKHVLQKSERMQETSLSPSTSTPLNLKLKEGETIRINVKTKSSSSSSSSSSYTPSVLPRSSDTKPEKKALISPLLAPPPGDVKLRKPLPTNSETKPNPSYRSTFATANANAHSHSYPNPNLNPTSITNSSKSSVQKGADGLGSLIDVSDIQNKFSNLETKEKSSGTNPPASGWAVF